MRRIEIVRNVMWAVLFSCAVMLLAADMPIVYAKVTAQEYEDVCARANAAYLNGAYADAYSAFYGLTGRGVVSGQLWYDLGACALGEGRPGLARVWFERARVLMPRDRLLHDALARVREQMKQPDVPSQRGWVRILAVPARDYTVRELVWFALCLYYLLGALVLLFLWRIGGRILILGLGSIVLAVFLLSVCVIPHRLFTLRHDAVITAPVVSARLEPADEGTEQFPLYEGQIVFLLREESGWAKIMRPDGRIGWIPAGDLERINPVAPSLAIREYEAAQKNTFSKTAVRVN